MEFQRTLFNPSTPRRCRTQFMQDQLERIAYSLACKRRAALKAALLDEGMILHDDGFVEILGEKADILSFPKKTVH